MPSKVRKTSPLSAAGGAISQRYEARFRAIRRRARIGVKNCAAHFLLYGISGAQQPSRVSAPAIQNCLLDWRVKPIRGEKKTRNKNLQMPQSTTPTSGRVRNRLSLSSTSADMDRPGDAT